MKIISYNTARVTWLFPLEEIGPLNGMNGANLIAEISRRYEFKNIPTLTTPEEMQKNGVKFGLGNFKADERIQVITELSVYSDGIVAVTERTEAGRLFLIDLLDWLRREFEFREFSSEVKELFLSEVTVEFDRAPLSRLLSSFEVITNIVSGYASPIIRTKDTMGLARIDLEFDRASPYVKQAAPRFVIERRLNVPFEQERYFCSAPMHTMEHIESLIQIETLAVASD